MYLPREEISLSRNIIIYTLDIDILYFAKEGAAMDAEVASTVKTVGISITRKLSVSSMGRLRLTMGITNLCLKNGLMLDEHRWAAI